MGKTSSHTESFHHNALVCWFYCTFHSIYIDSALQFLSFFINNMWPRDFQVFQETKALKDWKVSQGMQNQKAQKETEENQDQEEAQEKMVQTGYLGNLDWKAQEVLWENRLVPPTFTSSAIILIFALLSIHWKINKVNISEDIRQGTCTYINFCCVP